MRNMPFSRIKSEEWKIKENIYDEETVLYPLETWLGAWDVWLRKYLQAFLFHLHIHLLFPLLSLSVFVSGFTTSLHFTGFYSQEQRQGFLNFHFSLTLYNEKKFHAGRFPFTDIGFLTNQR